MLCPVRTASTTRCASTTSPVPRSGQQLAYGGVVVGGEGMNDYRLGDVGQPRLVCSVAPDLGQHWRSRVQCLIGSHRRCEERTSAALAAIDRDQQACVEDH